MLGLFSFATCSNISCSCGQPCFLMRILKMSHLQGRFLAVLALVTPMLAYSAFAQELDDLLEAQNAANESYLAAIENYNSVTRNRKDAGSLLYSELLAESALIVDRSARFYQAVQDDPIAVAALAQSVRKITNAYSKAGGKGALIVGSAELHKLHKEHGEFTTSAFFAATSAQAALYNVQFATARFMYRRLDKSDEKAALVEISRSAGELRSAQKDVVTWQGSVAAAQETLLDEAQPEQLLKKRSREQALADDFSYETPGAEECSAGNASQRWYYFEPGVGLSYPEGGESEYSLCGNLTADTVIDEIVKVQLGYLYQGGEACDITLRVVAEEISSVVLGCQEDEGFDTDSYKVVVLMTSEHSFEWVLRDDSGRDFVQVYAMDGIDLSLVPGPGSIPLGPDGDFGQNCEQKKKAGRLPANTVCMGPIFR